MSNLTPIYGEFYDDTPIAVSIPATGTYYQVTGMQVGSEREMTVATDQITCDKAGAYRIDMSQSFTHDVNNTLVHFSIFVNGVELTKIETERKIGTGGDLGCTSATGVVECAVGDIITLRAKADNIGTVTINHVNVNMIKI